MSAGDELLRAYAILKALRETAPEEYYVAERWTQQFNGALEKVEAAVGLDLQEFKLPPNELKRVVSSSHPDPRGGPRVVNYRDGLWCERTVFLQRVESVLIYFTGLQRDDQAKIGFRGNA